MYSFFSHDMNVSSLLSLTTAGITSKVLSAGASLLAPYGVYSVLTVHGAGEWRGLWLCV